MHLDRSLNGTFSGGLGGQPGISAGDPAGRVAAPRSSLWLALSANFLLRVAGAATGVMLTLYLAYINRELYPVSATELGMIAGGFYVTEMVAAPLLGAQSDRRGRRLLLVLGPLIGLVAVNLTALTTALSILFLTRILEGLTTSCATPSLLGYLSDHTDHDAVLRGRVMSWFEVGTALGIILGVVSGTLLWGQLGGLHPVDAGWLNLPSIDAGATVPWAPAFVAVGGMYVVCALMFWRVRDPRRPRAVAGGAPRASVAESFRRVLRYRSTLQFAPAWLSVNAIIGLWIHHAVYQMSKGHEAAGQYLVGTFEPRDLAIVMAAYTLAFGAGGLAWGSYIGRLGETRVMRLTLIGIVASGFMMGLVNHSGGSGPVLWLGVAGFFLAVLIQSGFAPAAVAYMARLSASLTEDRGLFMGLYSVVLGLGQVLGSWLGGPLADAFAMDGVLILTLVFSLVAALCVWSLPARAPAAPEPSTAGEAAAAEAPGVASAEASG